MDDRVHIDGRLSNSFMGAYVAQHEFSALGWLSWRSSRQDPDVVARLNKVRNEDTTQGPGSACDEDVVHRSRLLPALAVRTGVLVVADSNRRMPVATQARTNRSSLSSTGAAPNVHSVRR